MSRHVVLGSGQIGGHLAAQLVECGHDVVAVSRRGRCVAPGARAVAADVTDANAAASACAGASVIYFCLNAASYREWPAQFPPLQRAAVHAAAATGARLVVLENLYCYGPTGGRRLVESLPANAASAKARTRVAMTDELLAAHRAGTIDVAVGRASDFFGPGVGQSALGEQVVRAALDGRRAQVMGDPDLPHSYSYAPDVARGLRTLGEQPSSSGEVWHLPIAATTTTRALLAEFSVAAGSPSRVAGAGRMLLAAVGLFKSELRELRHTLYQFAEPWIVDDRKFRDAFGDLATPLPTAVRETVDWYRANPPKDTP